ncbi:MAG: BLUF domain-containing protein [Acetobacteraceae bacterium]|nr:BLUF domain-containing protein [Acetobacteraceae bacterium]
MPAPSQDSLVRLVYRSRATLPLAGAPLCDMLRAARRRNHSAGVTGLLVADRGQYLQWLEGPQAGVVQLMRSISLDRRHDSIELLSEGQVPSRRFAGWDMRLAADRAPAGSPPALHLPGALIDGLWADAARVPDLMATLGTAPRTGREGARGTALLDLMRGGMTNEPATPSGPHRFHPAVNAEDLRRFLAALVEDSLPVEAIALPGGRGDARRHFAALVEPAARRLGDLWMEDALSEFEVTIALGRLQVLVRHLGRVGGGAALRPHAPPVLVAPMPGEPHGLGATLDSEWLWLSGWPHAFEIAATDAALQRVLRTARFDLLDLSLSPCFERLDGAGLLRRRLSGFRAASCNPALRIRLSGRLFAHQPWLAGLVGADAVSGTSHGLDAALLRLAGTAPRA